MPIQMFTEGAFAVRNSNNRRVQIVEAQPTGIDLFYRVRDCSEGHTLTVNARDLRPIPRSNYEND